MKKFFRSAIAIILAISMMPLCFAIEPEPQGGIEWAALPDNTVVCYLYGLPVYKSDVDENGFINCGEVLDRPMPLNYSSYYTEGAIPSTYRNNNYILEGSGRYSVHGTNQYEIFTYLRYNNALSTIEYLRDNQHRANAVKNAIGSFYDALTDVFGVLPAEVVALYGAAVLITSINIQMNSSAADKIAEYTNSGKHVLFITIKTNYGTFYAVHEWDGINCVKAKSFISGLESHVFDGLAAAHITNGTVTKVW